LAGVAEQNSAAVLELLDRVLEAGHDPVLFLNHLMEQVRNILLLKIVPDAREKLGLAEDDAAAMAPLVQRFSQEGLLRILEAIAREEGRIKFSAQPRYLLEALAVRLCQLADLTPLEELLARFPAGEEPQGSKPIPRPPARRAVPPVPREGGEAVLPPPSPGGGADAPTPEAPRHLPAAPADGAAESRLQVERILERICSEKGTLGGFLSHASFFDLEENAFVISLPEDKQIFQASIERKEYMALIREAVESVTGRRLQIQFRVARAVPAAGMGPAPAAESVREARKTQLLQEASRSPVVQSFLDLFQGEITEIEEV